MDINLFLLWKFCFSLVCDYSWLFLFNHTINHKFFYCSAALLTTCINVHLSTSRVCCLSIVLLLICRHYLFWKTWCSVAYDAHCLHMFVTPHKTAQCTYIVLCSSADSCADRSGFTNLSFGPFIKSRAFIIFCKCSQNYPAEMHAKCHECAPWMVFFQRNRPCAYSCC